MIRGLTPSGFLMYAWKVASTGSSFLLVLVMPHHDQLSSAAEARHGKPPAPIHEEIPQRLLDPWYPYRGGRR